MGRGDDFAFPQPSDVMGRGLTIREHFALEIYKGVLINAGRKSGPIQEEAVRRADELIQYLQDNPSK